MKLLPMVDVAGMATTNGNHLPVDQAAQLLFNHRTRRKRSVGLSGRHPATDGGVTLRHLVPR